MPRGQRKPKNFADQITVKEELITNLEKQLKQEKDALKALKQARSIEEVEKLQKFILVSNLTPEEAIDILKEHTNAEAESAD